MRNYRFGIGVCLLLYVYFAQATAMTMTNLQQELFNGRDLVGWEHVGDGKFTVENGLLKTEGGMGLLWYRLHQYGNCIIKVVYKVTYPDSNSGIFVRIAQPPKDAWDAVHNGYEIQILDQSKDPYYETGAIYSIAPSSGKKAVKPPGQWNTMEIALRGSTISVTLNGVKVSEFNDVTQTAPPRNKESDPQRGKRPEFGYIGLQNHDHDAKQLDNHVYFKSISILPLVD